MSQYTKETKKILDDFTRALEVHPDADRAFVEQIKALVAQGKITHSQAIQEVVTTLKETVPDEP